MGEGQGARPYSATDNSYSPDSADRAGFSHRHAAGWRAALGKAVFAFAAGRPHGRRRWTTADIVRAGRPWRTLWQPDCQQPVRCGHQPDYILFDSSYVACDLSDYWSSEDRLSYSVGLLSLRYGTAAWLVCRAVSWNGHGPHRRFRVRLPEEQAAAAA